MDLPHFSSVSSWARNYRSHGSRTSQGTIKLRGRAERPSCSSDTTHSPDTVKPQLLRQPDQHASPGVDTGLPVLKGHSHVSSAMGCLLRKRVTRPGCTPARPQALQLHSLCALQAGLPRPVSLSLDPRQPGCQVPMPLSRRHHLSHLGRRRCPCRALLPSQFLLQLCQPDPRAHPPSQPSSQVPMTLLQGKIAIL